MEQLSSIKKNDDRDSKTSEIKDFVPANVIFRASEVLRLSSRDQSPKAALVSPIENKEPTKASKLPPPIIEVSSQKSSVSLQKKEVPKLEIENINKIEKKSLKIKKMAQYP